MKRVTHLFFILIALMCISFVYWSYYSELDIVSVADGQVVPTGKIKHIQHLEGGIIQKINIKEGDTVTKGQPLIELEQLMSGASLEEIQVRINALIIDVIRLKALIADKKNIVFPTKITKNHPRLIKDAQRLFSAHKNTTQSKIKKLNKIVDQKKQRIKTSRYEQRPNNPIHVDLKKNRHALLHLPEFEFTADCCYPI